MAMIKFDYFCTPLATCRRVLCYHFLTWHLRRLERDDAEIRVSIKHERVYMETMEHSVSAMLMKNKHRRYHLQRRLLALDRATL